MLLLVAFAGLMAPRAHAAVPEGDASQQWIRIERTECYGTCPVFTLRITAEGEVVYDGNVFVMRRGIAKRRLRPAEVDKLRRAIDRADFARLDTHCCDRRDRTDYPWTLIDIADQNGVKSIRHYHGCFAAPQRLTALEETIISLSGADKWIGSAAERGRQKWTRESQ